MAEKDAKAPVDEIEPVGPGAEIDSGEEVVHDIEDEGERDTRGRTAAQKDDGDGEEEERAGHAEDDEGDPDRTQLRESRRRERRQKKEQSKRDRKELTFLRSRNEQLERRQSEFDVRMVQTEVSTIDGRIQAIEADIRKADEVYAEAISKGDGQSAAEAQSIRDQLRDGLQEYRRSRQTTIGQAQQRLQQPRGPTVDPVIQEKAMEWVSENSWFDPQLGDDDSAIAKAIEDRLAREKGPAAQKTDSYWKELDRRLRKRLPHVFENDDDERDDNTDDEGESPPARRERSDEKPAKRNGGPRFTSGGRERPLKKNEVYVSEERRKAMEEAGVWEDPVTRNRYLKQYQKFDAEARRNRH